MTICTNRIRRDLPRLLLLGVVGSAAASAGTPPPGFVETQLVSGAAMDGAATPTAAAFEPGSGNLFVLEKNSRVRLRDAASGVVSTALTLACVDSAGERGLLGIAFAPDYLTTGRHVYLYYTRRIDSGACALAGVGAGTRFQVSRFTETSGSLHSEEVVLVGPHLTAATNHNAGAIAFAPDGTLFIATGDNNTDADPNPLSRDLSDLRGKLLRIHPDGSIPGDNPLVGQPGVRAEIWAWGLRNPFRFRFDEDSGAPIIGDVGEAKREAIYRGVAGADYGYPCVEGSLPFRACNPAPPAGSVTDPIFEYVHGVLPPPGVAGNSVTGGPVYYEAAFPPEYHGSYFFGDYVADWIRRGRFAADGRLVDVEMFIADAPGVVDILTSPNGCLVWVGILGDGVREVCYAGGTNGQPRAVMAVDTTAGLAPLTVGFDGSGSSDPDMDSLAFSWDFDDPPSTSTVESPSHMYAENGVYQPVLTVDDGQGEANSTDSSPPMRIVVGNRAPMPTISSPAAGTSYDAGDTIAFSGSGLDPDEGVLAASRLAWTVVFHHDTHTHPFLGPVSGVSSGSFTIPTDGEDSTNVFYRVHLSATDTGWPLVPPAPVLAATFVDLAPNVSNITLAASPTGSGLVLEFDRQPALAPRTEPSVVNFPRTIGAPSPQTTGSGTFFFQSWSDAGAAEHSIATPATDTTYTATFDPCTAAADDVVRNNGTISTAVTERACLTITVGTAYRVVAGGDLTLNAGVAVIFANGFTIEGGALTVDLAPPV